MRCIGYAGATVTADGVLLLESGMLMLRPLMMGAGKDIWQLTLLGN